MIWECRGDGCGMTNGSQRRRLRPLQVGLASTTVVLFVGLNALLSWSYIGLNETTEGFGAAVTASTTLSNVQRETLVLLDAVDRAGDADGFEHCRGHAAPPSAPSAHLRDRRGTTATNTHTPSYPMRFRKNFVVVEAAFASANRVRSDGRRPARVGRRRAARHRATDETACTTGRSCGCSTVLARRCPPVRPQSAACSACR